MLGSVSKHRNPRLRAMLLELAWLLMRWNPGYKAEEKWSARLDGPGGGRPTRKKVAVAIARQFVVDWWRIRTGRATPQELGLETKPAAQASLAANASPKRGDRPA